MHRRGECEGLGIISMGACRYTTMNTYTLGDCTKKHAQCSVIIIMHNVMRGQPPQKRDVLEIADSLGSWAWPGLGAFHTELCHHTLPTPHPVYPNSFLARDSVLSRFRCQHSSSFHFLRHISSFAQGDVATWA